MVFSALGACTAPAFSTGLGGTLSCAAANFLTYSVPTYILVFAVIFLVLGKIFSLTGQLAVMVFLISASGAYLLMFTGAGFGALAVTASDIVVAIGVIIAGFVLAKSAKLVGF